MVSKIVFPSSLVTSVFVHLILFFCINRLAPNPMKLSETHLNARTIARWGPLLIKVPPKAKETNEKKSKADAKLNPQNALSKKIKPDKPSKPDKPNKISKRSRQPINSVEKNPGIDSNDELEPHQNEEKIAPKTSKTSENISGEKTPTGSPTGSPMGSPAGKKHGGSSDRNASPADPIPNPEIQKKKLKNYLRRIRKKIDARKKYPYAARRFGLRENVYVRFRITSNGSPTNIRFPKPAHKLLKKACIDAIHAAAPFQKPPSFLGAKLDVEIVMAFKLE